MENALHHERLRLKDYERFAELYSIPEERFRLFVHLYDIDELQAAVPEYPTVAQREAFNKVLGAEGVSAYLDYYKTANTFELVMQWQEELDDFSRHAMSFNDFSEE